MAYKYSYTNYNKENMAKVHSTNIAISLKKTVEASKFIKNKKVDTAIKLLESVIEKKKAIPYTRYNKEMPHRRGKGIAAGGYPIKVAKELLRLLHAAKKNAKEQEISDELYVLSVSARKGTSRFHNGRQPGQNMKSTNVEIIIGSKNGGEDKK